MHDKISLSSLSQALVGLASQALSFRREPNGKDYLHEYYEQLALEAEKQAERLEELDLLTCCMISDAEPKWYIHFRWFTF